jgi:uncharacterized protein YaaW (UPF0174 family)
MSRVKQYEKPRKKISVDIPYDLYYNLKSKAREIKKSMTSLINESFCDVILKYGGANLSDNEKRELVHVLFEGEEKVAENNDTYLQFLLKECDKV